MKVVLLKQSMEYIKATLVDKKMFKSCHYIKSTFLSIAIFKQFDSKTVHDKIDSTTNDDDDKLNDKWKRLKAMYSYNDQGSISPELSFVSTGAFVSFLTGFILGGILDSRSAFLNYIEQNKATRFYSKYDASKSLQDKVTLRFFAGGLNLGWRICFFSTTFLTTVLSLSTYTGKTSLWNFIVGGSISGALYKFKHGPKPMIATTFVGGIFGIISGGMILGMTKITGISFREIIADDAELIAKYHKEREECLDEHRATYTTYNIGEIYRRGLALGSDDVVFLKSKEDHVTKGEKSSPK